MRLRNLIACGLWLLPTSLLAQELDPDIMNHPNSQIVAYYQSNEKEVLELNKLIKDPDNGSERLEAFSQLATDYPLAAEITARSLVSDRDLSLALLAVEYLKGTVVMSDHEMSHGSDGFSPLVRYTMQAHSLSRQALREGVFDERPEVRDSIAPFLASLSDFEVLQKITNAGAQDFYTDQQAAYLVTLASGDQALPLLEKYISSDNIDAQKTSVEYLAAFPQYQPMIRSEVFLNQKVDSKVRSAAAGSLSLYDDTFPTYALIVAGEQNVPPDLYQNVISGYVDTSMASGQLSPEAAANVSEQIKFYLQNTPKDGVFSDAISNIQSLENRLESYTK